MYLKFMYENQIRPLKIGFIILKTTGVILFMTTGGKGMGWFDNIDHYKYKNRYVLVYNY